MLSFIMHNPSPSKVCHENSINDIKFGYILEIKEEEEEQPKMTSNRIKHSRPKTITVTNNEKNKSRNNFGFDH